MTSGPRDFTASRAPQPPSSPSSAWTRCRPRRRGQNPQKTMPRAIIAALLVVTSIYILVAFAGLGTQDAAEFGSDEQAEAGLSVILRNVLHGQTWASNILALGAVISIFSVTLVVMYGQTRIPVRDGPRRSAAVALRQGQPGRHDAGEQHHHRGDHPRDCWPAVPIDYLWDLVSIGTLVAFIVVSVGVIILRVREPDLPARSKVPGPVTSAVGARLPDRAAACHASPGCGSSCGSPWCWCSTSCGAGTTVPSTTAATG